MMALGGAMFVVRIEPGDPELRGRPNRWRV